MAIVSGITRYGEKALLKHMFKVAPYTVPTHLTIALFTVAPSQAGGGTECADANYLRQTEDNWTAGADTDPESVSNTDNITFPAMAVSQAIVAVGVYDNSVIGQGNLIAWGLSSFTAGVGVQVEYIANAFVINMNGSQT